MSAASPDAAKTLRFPPLRLEARGGDRHAREFLPAALEIIETPASPAGRATALTITLAVVLAIIWASIGQVDIIATAPGRILPVGHSKTVQPLDAGIVRRILVDDGAHVRAGDALVELDPTAAAADQARLTHDLLQAELDRARLDGLRLAFGGAAPALAAPPANASPTQLQATEAAMLAQAAEQAAKLAGLDQQIAQKQAEGDEAAAALAKSQASLPWLRQQAELRRELLNVQFSNKLAWLEVEQRLAEQTHDLPVLAARQVEAAAAGAALERQRAEAVAEYRKTVLADLAKAEQQASQARQDLSKASEKLRQQVLRAPIDGTVQQLAVHTVGGVVSPAQAVLVVVPDDAGLVVEAQVANKDVGFVHAGQTAEVKVEAFSFTRYGLIHGTVVGVSRDAVTDDRARQVERDKQTNTDGEGSGDRDMSPSYTAHIMLGQAQLLTESGPAKLEAGMTVTAEIKTGRRSLISYLLSPLQRYAHEGLRER